MGVIPNLFFVRVLGESSVLAWGTSESF